MTTTYGTISTAPPPSDRSFLYHTRDQIRSRIKTRRPWKEMIISFSFPESFNTAIQRVQKNTSYFHVNYTIIVLFMIFMSLLWHPMSLLVFIAMMAAWVFLYFHRDDVVVVFGYGVDERVILVVLSIVTVVALFLTHAVVFVAGLVAGAMTVVAHGAFRRTNDLMFDVEEGGAKNGRVMDLKETAAASFSSSL